MNTSRSLLKLPLALAAALVFVSVGCQQPRKAAAFHKHEKEKAKANSILAKAQVRAAKLCPECVFQDSVTLAARVDSALLRYSEAVNVDSILAACQQYADAVDAERELYQATFVQQVRDARDSNVVTMPPPRPPAGPVAQRALHTLQQATCQFDPFSADFGSCLVSVKPGAHEPLISHEQREFKIPCPPHVEKAVPCDCPPVGVAPWYRTFTWIVLGIFIIAIVSTVMFAFRHMASPIVLALLCFAGTATAQDWTRTTSDKQEGERKLVLTGSFAGADTVLVQVYHDGVELYSDVAVGTFSITLGEHHWYMMKFTDEQHRVKRIAIHELSDDMVEFYPPIEVDFDRSGNLVLIKQSTGKPDWQEFDVGLSRKRAR